MIKLRLQARGRPRRHDSPGAQRRVRTRKRVGMTKRGVSQLRLQARGRSARSGLAGRSLACNRGFGLALKRSDGERHHARSGVASNKARDAASHASRGSWKPGPIRRLDRGCYATPRTRKRVRMTKRGVSQLRLQARGRSARSGLAGRCFLCNTASGLTRHRADGDRHHAHGNSSSSPRGGWEPGPIRRLDRGDYCDKRERERERERCVSAADASTYGPCWARGNPWHVCPHRTHAKTAPSPKRYRSLSKKNPLLRYKVDH